ncbi:MAG TPA: sodium:solute symporter, partial [Methyloceanibacter sp.]|nr:sodium:solute symporter [Methyloceanibacter sp.]
MRAPSRPRQANPHLGAYYGIIASAFVSLVICLAMFEQLGWQDTWLARTMMLAPLVLYLAVAFGARSLNVEDFFASGRRVPPVYNGAVLAAVLVGGIGFFAYTGTLFFLGFDALAIGLAWTTGLLVSGLLFVPYLRKAGAYTVPAFLGQRFRSRTLRAMASLLQLPPAAFLLAAEIKIAALIGVMFLPVSYQLAVAAVAIMVACVTIVGGMRSLTWTASTQFIVGAVGFAVPLIIVSVLLTNLPAPQLTYGEMLEPLKRSEMVAGLSPSAPGELATALPTAQPRPSAKP